MSSKEKSLPQLKVKLPGGKVLSVPASFGKEQEIVESMVNSQWEPMNPPLLGHVSDTANDISAKISQAVAKDAVVALQDIGAEEQQRLEKLLSNQLPADGKLADAVAERIGQALDKRLVGELDARIMDVEVESRLLNARIAAVLPDAAQVPNYQLPNMESLTLDQFRAELQKQGVSDAIIDGLVPEFDKVKIVQQAQSDVVRLIETQVVTKLSEMPPLELEHVLKPAMLEAIKEPVAFSEKLDVEAERLANLKPQGQGAETVAQAAEKPAVESKAEAVESKVEAAADKAGTFLRNAEGGLKKGKIAVMATVAAVAGLAYAKLRSSPEEKPAPQTVDSGEVSLPAVAMSRN